MGAAREPGSTSSALVIQGERPKQFLRLERRASPYLCAYFTGRFAPGRVCSRGNEQLLGRVSVLHLYDRSLLPAMDGNPFRRDATCMCVVHAFQPTDTRSTSCREHHFRDWPGTVCWRPNEAAELLRFRGGIIIVLHRDILFFDRRYIDVFRRHCSRIVKESAVQVSVTDGISTLELSTTKVGNFHRRCIEV